MPIYEFYCEDCNTIFNFFSRSINTTKKPKCPTCKTKTLSRQMSSFAFTGKAKEDCDMDDLPFDEGKMEKAMNMLAGEAENISEDDPRQAANLMRKLTDMTGEDPDAIEAEMGDLLEEEEPFLMPEKKGAAKGTKRTTPQRDETLYDL